jgi:hypothetical protein
MAAILVGVAACGPGNGLNLAPVQGKVTYKGEPIKNGTVMFVPDESKGATGPQAIGTIKSDGTYSLSSQDANDGAVVGWHKVGILGLDPEPMSKEEMATPEEDPMKYLMQKTQAGLKSARQSTKKDAVRTVTGLDGKTFRVVVPEKVGSTETSGISVEVSSGSNTLNFDIAEDGTAKITR